MTNLLQSGWTDLDSPELRFILLECIGKPGQYSSRESNPNTFYLPLAGSACQIKLTFSNRKEIVSIEPGPAFDEAQWEQIVQEVERTGPYRVGRDCSFSSYRVTGSWRGKRSGVQILPPPADAPLAPVEMAEHPFILEFPVKVSERWPITNFRRLREHRQLTFLLNALLAGRTTIQPRRPRHLWAIANEEGASQEVKWVQEFYFTKFGKVMQDELSQPDAEALEEVDPEAYYETVGHDGRGLRVPTDLDESICCYMGLSKANRDKFGRASFWTQMASRQWTDSLSASFASLAIAIESLAESGRTERAAKFRNFIEQYAPGASLEDRRREMYGLRSDILHGSGLMEMDQDTHFGWGPPEQKEMDLMNELWGLTSMAMRNWLKNPSTT